MRVLGDLSMDGADCVSRNAVQKSLFHLTVAHARRHILLDAGRRCRLLGDGPDTRDQRDDNQPHHFRRLSSSVIVHRWTSYDEPYSSGRLIVRSGVQSPIKNLWETTRAPTGSCFHRYGRISMLK